MYKIGDRVRCTGFKEDPDQSRFIRVGDTGTVVQFAPWGDSGSIEVRWDNPVATACGGEWWIAVSDCEPEATP